MSTELSLSALSLSAFLLLAFLLSASSSSHHRRTGFGDGRT
ncbi:hypothetical protein [Streptomyces sp. 35G-GA-8]|nr:hypothetical protein [Streptomyces sp. 35G-GA-8]